MSSSTNLTNWAFDPKDLRPCDPPLKYNIHALHVVLRPQLDYNLDGTSLDSDALERAIDRQFSATGLPFEGCRALGPRDRLRLWAELRASSLTREWQALVPDDNSPTGLGWTDNIYAASTGPGLISGYTRAKQAADMFGGVEVKASSLIEYGFVDRPWILLRDSKDTLGIERGLAR